MIANDSVKKPGVHVSQKDMPFSSYEPSILFIDDDPKLLQSLGGVLQTLGYDVQCLHDGADILDLIREREFDLVLTDLKMKSINGFEVLRAVKSYQPQTPVVIITGYASLLSAIEAIHEGAYDYLVKPCNIKEMQLTLERGIQQKRIQNERDQYYQELQSKNKELKEAMNQLLTLHEQLKESEQFRETMVSMFTHDIFNPVTSIGGFLTVMMSDPEVQQNQSHLQYIQIMHRNVKKIEFLANTFQTFYKIDSQKYEISLREINFCDVVRETTRNVEIFGFDKNIQVRAMLPEQPIMIYGDPYELERAITNILYNAIKYSPQNGIVECSLTLERSGDTANQPSIDPDKQYVVLTVKDFGIGIHGSALQKVFKKFYRAPNAKKYKGSGVGLFISKFVVDQHNGFITARSSLGKGSQFVMYLPVSDQQKVDIGERES